MNEPEREETAPAVDEFVAKARSLVEDMDALIDDLKSMLAEQDRT